jgi:myo-inositol-1(or 4)-monophosphatase
MHPMLNIAVRAARKAGNLIAKHYETPDSVETSQKGSNDFVTNVDKAARSDDYRNHSQILPAAHHHHRRKR